MALPYAAAVMKMLPQTQFDPDSKAEHEPTNDIHVHKHTMQQLFVPVSESRQFTREDAAKAFHQRMLSADARSLQPQLIEMERRVQAGTEVKDSKAQFEQETKEEEDKVSERFLLKQLIKDKQVKKVKTRRYEFRFRKISVEKVGPDGRGRQGTGWRYGAPLEDRKKGQVKIPTHVP